MEALILILPLFFALNAFIIPKSFARTYGIIGSVIVFATAILCLMNYVQEPVTQGIYHIVNRDWITTYGISCVFGYDSISLIMILLASGLVPLILLSNYKRDIANDKKFTAMVFLMLFGLIGVFTALDAIWFYAFWEITLIPIFLISWWYGAPDRKPALIKFFIYTFVGSIAMLAAIISLRMYAADFSWANLLKTEFESSMKAFWIAAGFMMAFAVKIPLFPFHTWQADTYEKSPMAGTMLLSGIMLKMALYGMIRWVLPILPESFVHLKWLVIVLAVIGVVYGAIIAIRQNDMKRLFAYASLSHVGLIAAGIMTASADAVSGAILQMINHGLVAVGLFLAADVIERRTGSRSLDQLGGIAKQAPKFAFWFAALAFASVSVPLTSGFAGEFLLIKGLYDLNVWTGIIAGTTLILGAVYTFKAYQLGMYGPVKLTEFADLHWSELIVFAVIMIVVVVLGVYPNMVLKFVQSDVNFLLNAKSLFHSFSHP